MKKFLSFTVTILVVGLLVGCSFGKKDESNIFDSEEHLLGFSALTSIKTLDSLNEVKTHSFNEEVSFASLDDDVEEDFEIEEIEKYLALIKSLELDKGFNVETSESDIDDYETLMKIQIVDINGEKVKYKLYYNETIIDEEESVLNGIMEISGVTYYLKGKKEIEIEDDEVEETIELKAYIDEETYVKLTYEVETETDEIEKEFKFSVYQNGKLIQSVKIEFEEEEDEIEVSLTFIEGNTKRTYEFEFEDDEIEIKIKIKEDGKTTVNKKLKAKIIIDKVTGEETIEYKYKD